MKSFVVFFHLVVLFSALTVLAAEDSFDYDPHLVHSGDIKLANIHRPNSNSVVGELMVAGRKDDQVPGWRYVCCEGFVPEGAKAVCNMLGYEDGESWGRKPELKPEKSSYNFTLTHLDCSKPMSNGAPPNHLLRCSMDPYSGNPQDCQRPVTLHCSNPKGYPLMDKGYEGQVQLCPPDEFGNETNPAAQVSMGIVSVFENTQWGSLNENDSDYRITHQQANSICRHLGFTGAVVDSARTVQSYAGQYTFSRCQHVNTSSPGGLQGVWLMASQARQCEQACPCFSCCYSRPGKATCPKGTMVNNQCTKGHCCQQNDVVIECTFDPTVDPPPETGSETTCTFQNGHAPCAQHTSDTTFHQEQVLIGVLVPTACIVLLVAMVIVIVVVRIRRKRRRRDGYNGLEGDNGGHANRGGNGNGNGNGHGHGNGNGNGGNGNGNN